MPVPHLLKLIGAGVGQTLLFVFAWGFYGAVWLRDPLPVSYKVAHLMVDYPSETTLVVTLVGTVLSVLTTSYAHFSGLSTGYVDTTLTRHSPVSSLSPSRKRYGTACTSLFHSLNSLVELL